MDIIYLIFSQAIGVVLGILKSIVLPMILSVSDFGYWQIYLLYVGYLGVLAVGFNDGLLLKYGKYDYEDLLNKKLGANIFLFMIFQFLLTILLFIIIYFFIEESKRMLFILISINIPLVGLNGVFLALFQSTNQIKKYSYFSIIDKLLMIITIIVIVTLDYKSVLFIIVVDIIARFVSVTLMFREFKSFFYKPENIFSVLNIKELFGNVKSGFYILISNLIAMLLIGYSLFLVERSMNLINYSIYSLGISTTNILLLFIAAVSVFIFPRLSRVPSYEINKKLINIEKMTLYSSILLINVYFFVHQIILVFLEKYSSLLEFLPFIFLSIIVQIKYNVLLVPYCKIIRKEKMIFKVNSLMLVFNIFFITISVTLLKSLLITSIFIFTTFFLRNIFLEKFIMNSNIHNKAYLFYYVLFLFSIYFTGNILCSLIVYSSVSITFLLWNSKKIKTLLKEI